MPGGYAAGKRDFVTYQQMSKLWTEKKKNPKKRDNEMY